MRLVFVSQHNDRSLLGESAGGKRVDVGEHAREIPSPVQLEVAFRFECGKIDAHVAESPGLLDPRDALRSQMRGVGQQRDGESSGEEREAALLEEWVHGGLVVIGEKDDDFTPSDLHDLVGNRLEEPLTHDLTLARIYRHGAEGATVIARRAGL